MATLSGDSYDKQRWLVETFGGFKRGGQSCGQNFDLPPLKRQRTGFDYSNGGAGFLAQNPCSFNRSQFQNQLYSVSNRNQRSFPAMNRIPQSPPANKISRMRVPAMATIQNHIPMKSINSGSNNRIQAPILNHVNLNPLGCTFMPSIQQIPLNAQIENPNPSTPSGGAASLQPLGSTISQDFRLPSQTSILDSLRNLPTTSAKSDLPPPPPLPPSGSALHELLASLVNQGLIKSTEVTASPQIQPKPDLIPIGLEFDPKLLNKRNETVITALYPTKKRQEPVKPAVNNSAQPIRQCSTCGIPFKTSGEHSRHNDWHSLKNRAAKVKIVKPSRRWFPNADELEAASAAVPESWLTNEVTVDDKKVGELVVVHADYDQKLCALCNEGFEDFYCDSTEDWMYKGAVYKGFAANGKLGPIVHAKCLLEPSVIAGITTR